MDPGSVADWVTAGIAAAGFAGAFVQLRVNLKDSRDARAHTRADEQERRAAMARAVGVKASWKTNDRGRPPEGHDGLMPVEVEVLNAGPHPISTAVLKVATDDGEMEIVYGTILPGEHLKDTHLVNMSEMPFAMLTSGVTLEFTDTYDNHWARSTYDLQPRDYAARVC